MLRAPPLALYVHLPWCVRKCPYCDFNSYALKGELEEERYLDALRRDLDGQAPQVEGRPVVSVFFGGGTPSLFSPGAIGRVLDLARARLAFAPGAEVTMEANPGAIERGRFAEYRAAGLNRVSLGAQTFDAGRLEALGRIHSPGDTRRAAEELHAAGVTHFNLDLMYGLPGQDPGAAVRDIEEALALHPDHLSHYQLTLEPGTPFAHRPPALPAEEAIEQMLEDCQAVLTRAGFDRYEVSAYARHGGRCRHNLNYWAFGDYLGLGAGAHGKLTLPEEAQVIRTVHPRDPRRYMAGTGAPARAAVPPAQLPFEFMLNALRLLEGFERPTFTERTGLPWDTVAPRLEELRTEGLIETEGAWYRPSPRGLAFLNEVLLRFVETPKSPGDSRLSTAPEVAAALGADALFTARGGGAGE